MRLANKVCVSEIELSQSAGSEHDFDSCRLWGRGSHVLSETFVRIGTASREAWRSVRNFDSGHGT